MSITTERRRSRAPWNAIPICKFPFSALFAIGLTLNAPLVLAASPTTPGTPIGTVSGDTVDLSWPAATDDEGVTGYNIYRDGGYLTTVHGTQARVSLSAGTQTVISVVAFDTPSDGSPRGYSALSIPAVFTRDGSDLGPALSEDPTRPTNLFASRASSSSVVLTWQASTDSDGVAGYNVYRDGAYLTSVLAPGFVDDGLLPNAAYEYYVVAYDTPRNFSERSATITASANVGDTNDGGGEDPIDQPAEEPTAEPAPGPDEPSLVDTLAPSPPANVAASTAAGGNLVTWDAAANSEGVVGYNVYRNDSYVTTVAAELYADANPGGASAEYYVVAFDEARNFSQRSDIASASGPVNGTDDDAADTNDTTGAEPPTLDDSFAEAIPSPLLSDPFGYELETDPEAAVVGGAPTQPKNLRLDIVGNDWAEFSWAPSNDDGEVVAYEVTRSDGVSFLLTPALEDGLAVDPGTYDEYAKYWTTTSFIDCNATRFSFAPGSDKAADAPWNCVEIGPRPGDDFSYTVAAIDNEGQRSPESEPLDIAFAEQINSPVPLYNDIYLASGDRFASLNNLSEVRFFLDDFDLIFEEEFDGDIIEPSRWNTGLVWGDTRIINGEQQYFVNTQQQPEFGYDPFNLDGDADTGALDGEGLSIEAVPIADELRSVLPPVCEEPDPTGLDRCEFLSGALSSHDRFSFIYGYVEGRIRASTSFGSLSSFFLFHRYEGGENDVRLRHGPEIDILEYLGTNPFGDADAFQNYHYTDPNTGIIRSSPTMNHEKNPDDSSDVYGGEYHTFGVLWEPQLVIWYIDGVEVKRLRGPQIGRQPMNIVNYLVAGSAWAPTPQAASFPMQMDIDYIRVFQREAFQPTANFGN